MQQFSAGYKLLFMATMQLFLPVNTYIYLTCFTHLSIKSLFQHFDEPLMDLIDGPII
jgi:hypothetical protein